MVAQTKFDVASAALVMVGASPVTTFTGTSAEAIACTHNYDVTVNNLLEMHPWRFASKRTQLSRLSTDPDFQWSARYEEPSGMRRLQSLQRNENGAPLPYDRFTDGIYCDAGTADLIYATYTFSPSESLWPGYFTKLVQLDLAMIFAVTLAAKIDLQESLGNLFERQFRYAKTTDSVQQTSRKLRTAGAGSILELRRS